MTGLPSELLTPAGNVTYIALVDLITFRENDIRTFDLFHIYDPYSYYTVFTGVAAGCSRNSGAQYEAGRASLGPVPSW
jgi:hypothetical protein